MPKKSSKHENVQQVTMMFTGGLNYAEAAANIEDNELKRAINFIYDPSTDALITRPGTKCQTAAALPSPIVKGFYYEVDATHAYHVCAAGKKLYYLSGTTLNAWTEIGTDVLTGTYTPSFLVFNKLLYIADGHTGLKTWNGPTLGTFDTTITDSPPATALSMIKNRMVANSITDLDLITFSAPNDASDTGWDTATTAVALRAGFGDMLSVNAFAVLGDDLIVSKTGGREKRIYRVNVSEVLTTSWYVQDLSQNNAAQNAHTMIGAWNNVFFVDTNGFKSLKGTDTYGDLQVDPVGRKINTVFQQTYTSDGIAYLPAYNAVWFNIGGRVFCYTERKDDQGNVIPAFTDLYFIWDRCTSMYEAGDTVYLTGWDGYLHKLDESVSTDEVTPGVTSVFVAAVRGKTFTFFVDGILRKLQWYLNPKTAGTGNMYVCSEEETKILLGTVTITAEGTYLYDETGYFTAELMPNAVDRNFTGGSTAWADVDLVSGGGAFNETTDLTITAGVAGAGDYCTLPVASAPTTIGKTYRMKYDLANLVGTWTLKSYDGTQTIGTISANATQAYLEWTATTTGGYRLVAVSNNASGDFDNFILYDVTSDITDELYNTGSSSWIETSRNRVRDQKMAFELELTSGRCGIQWCKAEIALLEGGE